MERIFGSKSDRETVEYGDYSLVEEGNFVELENNVPMPPMGLPINKRAFQYLIYAQILVTSMFGVLPLIDISVKTPHILVRAMQMRFPKVQRISRVMTQCFAVIFSQEALLKNVHIIKHMNKEFSDLDTTNKYMYSITLCGTVCNMCVASMLKNPFQEKNASLLLQSDHVIHHPDAAVGPEDGPAWDESLLDVFWIRNIQSGTMDESL